jgi:hypothetical protein
MSASRFDRPTYASRATQPVELPSQCAKEASNIITQTIIKQSQPLQFSPMKTVAERQEFKPFGKAIDTVQNKNITNYGEDVFIEYNPIVFLGKQGNRRADAYLNHVINAYAKNEPVTDIIMLKAEFADNSTFDKLQNAQSYSNTWDWWGDDDINEKINAYELNNSLLNAQNGINHKQKITITELIPEVIDKIHIANKLIREMASFNPKSHDTVTFRNLQSTTARPTHSNARFEPVRRNMDNHADKQTHADFDDNYSIRISNFSDPDSLTTYSIKDVLYEFMDNIPIKVSIPRNKETNKNKDFAFINFVSETDLNNAFEQLSKQRIFMDSAILYIEVSKRRTGY